VVPHFSVKNRFFLAKNCPGQANSIHRPWEYGKQAMRKSSQSVHLLFMGSALALVGCGGFMIIPIPLGGMGGGRSGVAAPAVSSGGFGSTGGHASGISGGGSAAS
jgi:hypothetical protein